MENPIVLLVEGRKRKLARHNSYGRLNPNINLESVYLGDVPSLHLMDESVYEFDQPNFTDELENVDKTLGITATDILATSQIETDGKFEETNPGEYNFSTFPIVLQTVSDSFHIGNMQFRKVVHGSMCGARCTLALINQGSDAVAFKVMSTDWVGSRAIPNRAVLPPNETIRVTIFLKVVEKCEVDKVRFQFRLAPMIPGYNLVNIWSKQDTIFEYSPLLSSVLLDNNRAKYEDLQCESPDDSKESEGQRSVVENDQEKVAQTDFSQNLQNRKRKGTFRKLINRLRKSNKLKRFYNKIFPKRQLLHICHVLWLPERRLFEDI